MTLVDIFIGSEGWTASLSLGLFAHIMFMFLTFMTDCFFFLLIFLVIDFASFNRWA